MADILTVSDYKTAKGITTTDYDTQLAALVPMANKHIENYCHREFGVDDYEEQREGTMDFMGRYLFKVTNKPIITVTSVAVHFLGTDTPLNVTVADLDIFKKAGYCYYSNVFDPSIAVIRDEYRSNWYYVINYNGGIAVPKPVQLAAIYIVSDTFEYLNRTNSAVASGTAVTGELKGVKIGGYSESYSTSDGLFSKLHSKDAGMVLTPTVKALLNPYVVHDQSW